jgi:hypothetical protein
MMEDVGDIHAILVTLEEMRRWVPDAGLLACARFPSPAGSRASLDAPHERLLRIAAARGLDRTRAYTVWCPAPLRPDAILVTQRKDGA